jgi:hypothetical protein
MSGELEEHIMEAFYENVDFMRHHGASEDEIRQRSGLSKYTYDKRLERRNDFESRVRGPVPARISPCILGRVGPG